MLKVHGGTWIIAGALNVLNARNGTMKKEISYANGAVCAGVGGLLLAQGLRK